MLVQSSERESLYHDRDRADNIPTNLNLNYPFRLWTARQCPKFAPIPATSPMTQNQADAIIEHYEVKPALDRLELAVEEARVRKARILRGEEGVYVADIWRSVDRSLGFPYYERFSGR